MGIVKWSSHFKKNNFYDRIKNIFMEIFIFSWLFIADQPTRSYAWYCWYIIGQKAKTKSNNVHIIATNGTWEDIREDALSRYAGLDWSNVKITKIFLFLFRCICERRISTKSRPYRVKSSSLVSKSTSKIPTERTISHK